MPLPDISTQPLRIRSAEPVKLPIGVSDFSKLVREGYTFVDKTLLIAELLNGGAETTLIARPRRFGKTLNLSMLQHFFAARTYGQPTQNLFDGLTIAQYPAVMAHQGRYPVIFFTFKNIKAESFKAFEQALGEMLGSLFDSYPELADSPRLSARERTVFAAMVEEKESLSRMADAFRLLSELLGKHYGQQVVILLDEYDTPIHAAFIHGYYERLIRFMRDLLGSALKDNAYLFKSAITGILKISKENLFSDLNNLEVHTVLDDGYGQHFGFTEPEVSGLLQTTGLTARQPALEAQIKDWYNGYRFGAQVIYNPWSIVNCLKQDGDLKAHWVNTSGHALLKQLIARAEPSFKQEMQRLLQHEATEQLIDPNLVFGDLNDNSTALWSLLLFSGYLTATEVRREKLAVRCRLVIPNLEIRYLYEEIARQWFTDRIDPKDYQDMLDNLVSGRVAPFVRTLQRYLKEAASYFDVKGDRPERFYHGFVLGLIVALQDSHVIYSNRESGDGRYDVALLPRHGGGQERPGIIMEFKQVDDPKEMESAAEEALRQIQQRGYATELERHGIANVLALGLAFSGKRVAVKSAGMA